MGGERVVSLDVSNYVLEWNAIPGNVEKRFTGTSVGFAGFSKEGPFMFLAEGTDLVTYETNGFEEVARQTLSAPAITFYLDAGVESGRMVYAEREKVVVAEVSSGNPISQWEQAGLQNISAEFLSGGTKLLINYGLEDGSQKLEVRDANTGDIIFGVTPELPSGTFSYALASDGGKLLLSEAEFDHSNDGPPPMGTPTPSKAFSRLIDMTTGETVLTFENEYFPKAIFTPDGSQLVNIASYGSRGTLKSTTLYIWDTITGEFRRELSLPTQTPSTFEFHPDGKSFFTGKRIGGGAGGSPPHPSGIFPLGISYIAKANFHQWDFETGDLIREFPLQVAEIKISPDGKFFVTNSSYRGGDFRVWRLDSQDELVAWACQNRFVADFTPEQMALYRITSTKNVCE